MVLRALLAGFALLLLLVPGGVWAGTCTFQCELMNGSTPMRTSPRTSPVPSDSEDACRSTCTTACPTYLNDTLRREGATAVRCVGSSVQYSVAAASGGSSGSDACGAAVQARRAARETLSELESAIQPDWVCRIPPDTPAGSATAPASACREFPGCYGLNPAARCCPPNIGTPPGRPVPSQDNAAGSTKTESAPAASRGLAGRLNLPACATSRDPDVAGKCTLEDIVGVAVNFANFLMGLAAAIFLAIFVWAGFKYIFFAYDPGVAGEARQMLVNAAIGMLLVLGAATIVRFVQTAATGRPPADNRCPTQHPSFSCQDASRLPETQRQNCTAEALCPGGRNIRCCPTAPSARGTSPTPSTTPTPAPTPPTPSR